MALYWLCAKYVSRGQGRSFAGATAYRIGEKLHCEYDGKTHDYRRRRDIIHAEILLPQNAPHEYLDYQSLGNAVEAAEKRNDARTAREIVIALPREFTFETDIALVRDFVTDCLVSHGMGAVIAIHRGDSKEKNFKESNHLKILRHNPHCHILLTTRPIALDGFSDKKNRDWDKRDFLIELREQWASVQNKFFIRKGLDISVSHESYEKQGILRKPTRHLGPACSAMELRGIKTHLGNINREIQAENQKQDEQEHINLQQKERHRSRGISR